MKKYDRIFVPRHKGPMKPIDWMERATQRSPLQVNDNGKPRGLWYGINTEWLEWCESQGYGDDKGEDSWIGDHFYRLDVDTSKLLIIGRDMSLDAFDKEFHQPLPYPTLHDLRMRINWQAVAERWSGIEIPFYSWAHRHELMWYYGWDVASGCIWTKDALKGIELIADPRKTKEVA